MSSHTFTVRANVWHYILSGADFINGPWAHKSNIAKHTTLFTVISQSEICTNHNNSVVEACAKLWSGCTLILQIQVKRIFTRCGLWDQKTSNLTKPEDVELAKYDFKYIFCWSRVSQIAKFMGPTWGPSGADRSQVGPMWTPWTLLSSKKEAQDTLLHSDLLYLMHTEHGSLVKK